MPPVTSPTYRNRILAHHYPDAEWRRLEEAWETTAGDAEDYHLCIRRERWQEGEVMTRAGIPSLVLMGLPTTKHGLRLGHVAFTGDGVRVWDRQTSAPAEFLGKEVMLRAMAHCSPLLRAIDHAGRGLAGDATSHAAVERWPEVVDPWYLKRRVSLISMRALRDHEQTGKNQQVLNHAQAGVVFLKTIEKGSHGQVRIEKPHFTQDFWTIIGSQMERWSDDTQMIISEPVKICEDGVAQHPRLEYRCQVVDRIPISWSRYLDYEQPPVPGEVIDFTRKFSRAHAQCLPPHYVLDVMLTESHGLAVVELNSFHGSGRYRGNEPHLMVSALLYPEDERMQRRLQLAWESVQEEDVRRLAAIVPCVSDGDRHMAQLLQQMGSRVGLSIPTGRQQGDQGS